MEAPITASMPEGARRALDRLRAGNERFHRGEIHHPNLDLDRRRAVMQGGQKPFATIVACSDSRVPVELLFDVGIGDLFVVRVAGNVIGRDATGSIEFAVSQLDCPLVVVLGHRHCGAVGAALSQVDATPHITSVLDRIQPAIERARQAHGTRDDHAALLDRAIEENVRESIKTLLAKSRMVAQRVGEGRLAIVDAVYDIEAGRVRWGNAPAFA
ncbi:MAG: carbonic anhydrase [Phycisphaerae bacterium]|jgi:carbonic anhydrase